MGSVKSTRETFATMSFSKVYPMYLAKVEKKGRSQAELDEVITWLTGLSGPDVARLVAAETTFEALFEAATLNPHAGLITGVVCGVRVEEIEDDLIQRVRYLDKLVDELAKGRKMEKILRAPA